MESIFYTLDSMFKLYGLLVLSGFVKRFESYTNGYLNHKVNGRETFVTSLSAKHFEGPLTQLIIPHFL